MDKEALMVRLTPFVHGLGKEILEELSEEIQSLTEERTAWMVTAENAEAELKAIKEAEPVAWQSPDNTENVPKLVWLREKESVFLGYHFEQPFREYRDSDGFYTGQQDAESYWARYEDGEPCEPDGWCQLNPPLYTLQGESK